MNWAKVNPYLSIYVNLLLLCLIGASGYYEGYNDDDDADDDDEETSDVSEEESEEEKQTEITMEDMMGKIK